MTKVQRLFRFQVEDWIYNDKQGVMNVTILLDVQVKAGAKDWTRLQGLLVWQVDLMNQGVNPAEMQMSMVIK